MKALYLSGAPRLSTKETTESLGPRSHILGVISGLLKNGVAVDTYIAGDHVRDSMHSGGSEARMSRSPMRIVATDLLRLFYRMRSRRRVSKLVSAEYDFCYERYALFQELGSIPQRRGVFWVLEVNALLSVEGTSDRRATTSRWVAARLERATLRKANLIVAVTQALADEIVRVHRVDAARIIVVANGVNVESVDGGTVNRDTSVDGIGHESPVTIGFLGTLYPWQNVDVLLEALTDPRLSEVRLQVAGGGPELPGLRKRSADLGLSTRVELLGPVVPTDVRSFLATNDLFFAGHGGTGGMYFSPLKLWEYLAAGRPVISNSHGLVEGLRDDGYAIVTYPSVTPTHIANAITEAIESLDLLSVSAALGPERIALEHSWEARVRGLLTEIGARNKPERYRTVDLKWGLGSVTPMTAREVANLVESRPQTGIRLANLNLHGLYVRQTDRAFKTYTDSSEVILVDGWPVLCTMRGSERRTAQYRVGSTDWLDLVLADDPDIRVVAVGGTPAVSEEMTEFVGARTHNLEWVGFDGFSFTNPGQTNLREAMMNADLVLVGLGMPKQEQWILENCDGLRATVANVGGCFDYYVGAQRLAPRWMGKIGLEWLFRLANDPRRLAGRYLVEPFQLISLIASGRTMASKNEKR